MRAQPALILLLACLLASSCGSSGSGSSAVGGRPTTAANAAVKKDRDNDSDNNDDDWHVLAFGQVPGATERQAITKLVDDYFAAALAGDGRRGCALLTPLIAESVVESYGSAQGMSGRTCAESISKMFRSHHAELARKVATLKVMRIGVQGTHSLVALEVPAVQEVRQVILRKVGSRWTMLSLLDGIVE